MQKLLVVNIFDKLYITSHFRTQSFSSRRGGRFFSLCLVFSKTPDWNEEVIIIIIIIIVVIINIIIVIIIVVIVIIIIVIINVIIFVIVIIINLVKVVLTINLIRSSCHWTVVRQIIQLKL